METRMDQGTKKIRIDQGTKKTRMDQGTKKTRIDQGTMKTRMDQGTKKTRIDQGTKKTRMDQGTMKTRIDQGTKKTLDGPRKLIYQKHSKNRLRPQILKMLDRSLTFRSFLFTKHKNAVLFSFLFIGIFMYYVFFI